jgi:hypothetical protein
MPVGGGRQSQHLKRKPEEIGLGRKQEKYRCAHDAPAKMQPVLPAAVERRQYFCAYKTCRRRLQSNMPVIACQKQTIII